MRLALTLVLVTALSGISVPGSAAESRKDLGLRLDALQARVDVLESRMLTGDPAAVRLQQRLDAMEVQLRAQTGTSERLEFENRRRQDEVVGLQSAIDILTKEVSTASENARMANAALGRFLIVGGEPAAEEQTSARIDDERALEIQQSYKEAKSYLEQGYFDQARVSFENFVAGHGEEPLAGPALFWLGEIAAVQGDYRRAANAYIETLKRFSKGSKAPEAMIKLGAAFSALGDKEEACRTLKAFQRQYPKATAGVRARAGIERRRAGCS